MNASDYQQIRGLIDEYLRMYASRDDRLTTQFSDDFSGFTGGGDFLVKDREQWVAITRQDFAQVKEPIRIELKDMAMQSLAETIAVVTSFFTIHLPIKDHILSRETARLVLVFRKEAAGWRISHSSISIPYHLVREGEVYPLQELVERNQSLERLVAERTLQLSEANARLQQANGELAREISQHKKAKEALQRSELLYRSILNASPDDITITDMEGRVLLVSPAAVRMFRCEGREAEFLGRPVTDFLVCGDRARALSQVALKRRGVVTGPMEYCALRPDGTTFDIEVNSEFIRDGEGAPTGMVVIVRDITERRQAQVEKEKLEVQNRQLQKAESLGRMAGAIAHHFNNQLQAVMMNLEMAGDDLPSQKGPAGYLAAAMQSVRKAAEVSSLMLTYLGQAPGKQEPLDTSAVCQRLLPMLQAAIPNSAVVVADLPSPGPLASANLNQIQQVLTNLITNAWEASVDGRARPVRLAVKTVASADIPAKHRFPINWQPEQPAYACLEVSDEGCGIPSKDIERIFDPFFSSKFPGRGMGLAVVLGIVRAHSGVITVETQPSGSVFRVFLPLSAEAMPRVPFPANTARSAMGRRSVLVVEDESAVRNVVVQALKHLGYKVHAAADGVEALEIFRQHQNVVDCVLCDLTMPRMDGWKTLAALRELAPDLPVILASGYSEAQVLEGPHLERPQAFLNKPYQLDELRQMLSCVLDARTKD